MATSTNHFLNHIVNTPALQTEMQSRLLTGESLEAVTLATAKSLGYAVTFTDITAVLDNHPTLADKIMVLLPMPMLELDEVHLAMIAGGGGMSYTDQPDADNSGRSKSIK